MLKVFAPLSSVVRRDAAFRWTEAQRAQGDVPAPRQQRRKVSEAVVQPLARVEAMPPIRDRVDGSLFNEALEALATFRETHLGFAREYIARRVDDPRGTGGTPYLEWLGQLIAETRAYMVP